MNLEKLGEYAGFILMFFIFATILFFILTFLDKIPESWTYFHVIFLVLFINIIGFLIKKTLR